MGGSRKESRAEVLVPVVPSGSKTVIIEVLPGGLGQTSVATVTAIVTAGDQLLRGDPDREVSSLIVVAVDAESVGYGIDDCECPAGSTVCLVSDVLDGLTSRLFELRGEAVREIPEVEVMDLDDVREFAVVGHEGAHQMLNLGLGHVSKPRKRLATPGSGC